MSFAGGFPPQGLPAGGGDLELLHHNQVTNTDDSTEVELDSKTIAAAVCNADEDVFVIVHAATDGGTSPLLKIRWTDATTTLDLTCGAPGSGGNLIYYVPLSLPAGSTQTVVPTFHEVNNGTVGTDNTSSATPDSAWITAAFTLSLRGHRGSTGGKTLIVRWWVYRRKNG